MEATAPDNRVECPFGLKADIPTGKMPRHMAFHHEQIAAFTLSWYISDEEGGEVTWSKAQVDTARLSAGSLPVESDGIVGCQISNKEGIVETAKGCHLSRHHLTPSVLWATNNLNKMKELGRA